MCCGEAASSLRAKLLWLLHQKKGGLAGEITENTEGYQNHPAKLKTTDKTNYEKNNYYHGSNAAARGLL